ncbi:hypothetical protein AB835_13770 [Candidatus Endobugula sertula]|uniref:DUF2000 domain-containing protein n=1 Tax=Candidatus Endobugula sertula TaxID=62101 RepID=A0A1D2QLR0_9GAMM|nr:hypothetical protein AB835_13770 [Candidatus Endobugula sertula]
MSYLDNEYKYIVAVFSKVENGILFNAANHAILGLGSLQHDALFLDYKTNDEKLVSKISKWPIIVLKTDRQALLKKLHVEAGAKSLPVNTFTMQMIGESAEDQLKATQAVDFEDAKILAVSVFCKQDDLSDITKKMSLFK